jgi:hypothetical protein
MSQPQSTLGDAEKDLLSIPYLPSGFAGLLMNGKFDEEFEIGGNYF